MDDKGRSENGTMRTANGVGNGAPPEICLSVKGVNGAPRTMDEFEGGDEYGNGATPPRKAQ